MTIITGRIGDSAGQAASGRIEFAQATRLSTGEMLITQTIATAQVTAGDIHALDGGPFALPPNLTGSAVRVREILGGSTYEWWTQIPDVASVAYQDLVPVVVIGPSMYGPPPWLAGVLEARDEAIAARDGAQESVQEAQDLVDALGGLTGIQTEVAKAETAAAGAAVQADRAEAAAASIDMTALNARMDGMDDGITGLAGDMSTLETTVAGKASQAAVDAELAKLRRVDPVEGVSLYSYGHSYTMMPGPYSTPNGGEYQLRVGRRLNMGTVYSRGRSGTPAPDTFARMLAPAFGQVGGVVCKWTPGDRGIVLLQNYMNEAAAAYGSDPKYLDMWLRTVRSIVALVSSGQHLLPGSATKVGTWTKSAGPGSPLFAGDDLVFAQSASAELQYQVTGDEIWVVAAASSTYALGDFKVICNGVTLRTVATNGTNPTYASTAVTNGFDGVYWPCAYKVTGLNAAAGTTGTKTVRVMPTSTTTTFQNGILVPSAAKPHVFLAKEPTRNPNAADTAASARFAAIRASYEAMVDQIASEFPNVHAVNLEPGWDNTRFVGSLDTTHRFHPNDLGMQHIAGKFEQAIRAQITTSIDGVMVL